MDGSNNNFPSSTTLGAMKSQRKKKKRPMSANPSKTRKNYAYNIEDRPKTPHHETLTDMEATFLVRGRRSRRLEHLRKTQGCFDVFPAELNFGDFSLHDSKALVVCCKNLGTSAERLSVKPSKDKRIKISYENNVLVAPGMNALVKITISGIMLGKIDTFITVFAGNFGYDIPIHATVTERLADVPQEDKLKDINWLDFIPRLPNTHYSLIEEKIYFERSFQYELDPNISVDEIKQRDEERTKRLNELPLPPNCERVHTKARKGDELEKYNTVSSDWMCNKSENLPLQELSEITSSSCFSTQYKEI